MMNKKRVQALLDISSERERQTRLATGGMNMDEFDQTNTANDWIAYINAYTGRAARKVSRNYKENQGFRSNMVKAGALCVAAIEAYDKNYFE